MWCTDTEHKEFQNLVLRWKEAEEEVSHTFLANPKDATTSGLDEGHLASM